LHKYKDIKYNLVKRKRKTISIYVERDGDVQVIVPERMSIEEVENAIELKRTWIYSKLTEWEYFNDPKVEREFVNGESFMYLGRNYRLEIVDNQDTSLKLYHGSFSLRKKDVKKANDVFKQFYKEKGFPKIQERVEHYKKIMDVEPKQIRIIDLSNRWGSCTDDGGINFHWKTLMAPMKIIDYIVVHELAHLIYKNHSPEFWSVVDKIMPDYKEREMWLDENGASLDI